MRVLYLVCTSFECICDPVAECKVTMQYILCVSGAHISPRIHLLDTSGFEV